MGASSIVIAMVILFGIIQIARVLGPVNCPKNIRDGQTLMRNGVKLRVIRARNFGVVGPGHRHQVTYADKMGIIHTEWYTDQELGK